MRTITFTHFKGGTGKTTSCLAVAGYLASHGSKVLAIDMDPQANLTTGLGLEVKKARKTMHHVMKGSGTMKEAIIKSDITNLHVAPANHNLAHSAPAKYSAKKDAFALKRAIKQIKNQYDFILVDLPPSNHYFIANGVLAADNVVLVLDEGHFSLRGIEPFKESLVPYCKKLGVDIEPAMVLVNKCQKSGKFFGKNRGKQVAKEAEKMLNKKVFQIPHSKHIHGSQEEGIPISHYKPHSKVGRAYMEVASHLIAGK